MIAIKTDWLKHAISCTCEVIVEAAPGKERFCDAPTVAAYPVMGGGWQSLCSTHAKKHLPNGAYHADHLILAGGSWK